MSEKEDLENLTIEQINELYSDIIEIEDSTFFLSYSDGSNRCGKGCDVRHGFC